MFIRAYLRASTEEQDVGRARESLEQFAVDHDKAIASVYLENASGATAVRPELLRLLKDARKGDVLLVESDVCLQLLLSRRLGAGVHGAARNPCA